jgi:tetratricopeptide (TPR) repeat protein
MRRTGKITAALLVAAVAAVGCSKDNTSETKNQEPQRSAKALPVSLPTTSTPAGDKGIDKPAPALAGPVSFADGEAAYQAGKYAEARQIFEQYTLNKPKNPWGYFMLGLSESKGGDSEKAEKSFEEALTLDPNHMKSLLNLSRMLIDKGRFDDAIVKLTRAGEVDASSAEVQRLLGRAYNGLHKNDEAVKAYRQAITLDPKDAWSMNNLGLILLNQGKADEAAPLFAKAVELRKDVPAFHNNLGMALEHKGQFSEAASEYKGALTADPSHEKAQRNLSRVETVKEETKQPATEPATAPQK